MTETEPDFARLEEETTTVVVAGLPPGLTLDADGTLSGIPETAGVYQVTVQVTDSAGTTASSVLQLTVLSPLAITVTVMPAGVTGQAYTFTLTATGGVPPYTWSQA